MQFNSSELLSGVQAVKDAASHFNQHRVSDILQENLDIFGGFTESKNFISCLEKLLTTIDTDTKSIGNKWDSYAQRATDHAALADSTDKHSITETSHSESFLADEATKSVPTIGSKVTAIAAQSGVA